MLERRLFPTLTFCYLADTSAAAVAVEWVPKSPTDDLDPVTMDCCLFFDYHYYDVSAVAGATS